MGRYYNRGIHRVIKTCLAIIVCHVVRDARPTSLMLPDDGACLSPDIKESTCGRESSSNINDTLSHRYLVVDLSGGISTIRYPIGWIDYDPHNGWSDEYKTQKLVLRRILPGTFIMDEDTTNEQYRVTLTKAFYIGVFEVTQRQWELVMGTRPSAFAENYEKRPVESVSYEMIRGKERGLRWPRGSEVDSDSFLGVLRKRTGLDFDLPTEQQWDYACSAGLDSVYSYGNTPDGRYMWSRVNSDGQTHDVGLKLPNQRGLFDMHGNVSERCVNKCSPIWYLRYGKDPPGSPIGSYFMTRGGNWASDEELCRTHRAGRAEPSKGGFMTGFRLCLGL